MNEGTDFLIVQRKTYPHPADAHMDLVLAQLLRSTWRPYVVWAYNRQTDSFHNGDYFATRAEAEAAFATRYARLREV